jgi:hypothetical protein
MKTKVEYWIQFKLRSESEDAFRILIPMGSAAFAKHRSDELNAGADSAIFEYRAIKTTTEILSEVIS